MKFWKYLYIFLIIIVSLIIIAIFQIPDGNFHIIACDVGQGDATLLIYKDFQILIDGGPDKKVLSCLGNYLPFWDREIELVILTHPDSDHFAGLAEVFKRYTVDNYLNNSITVSSSEYGVLEKLVGREGVRLIYPYKGQQLKVQLIQLDILAPFIDKNVTQIDKDGKESVTDESTNTYSIVSLVSFGNFKALLTGDMSPDVSDRLAENWSPGNVNYIKMSHHGSKNGTTVNLLKALMPNLAVISVGKNNYGQPAPETLSLLNDLGIKYLRTDKKGDIEVVSDGKNFWIK